MWIFSRYGFYSVTLDPLRPEQFQVRARREADLRNLSHYGLSEKWLRKNIRFSGPRRDYPCRIFIDKARWTAVAVRMLADIDYTNFKDAATAVDPSRHDVLLDVWADTFRLEDNKRVMRAS